MKKSKNTHAVKRGSEGEPPETSCIPEHDKLASLSIILFTKDSHNWPKEGDIPSKETCETWGLRREKGGGTKEQ